MLHRPKDLFAAGHEVLLIEQQPEIRDRAEVADGVEWCIADAREVTSLSNAGLERCDVVVAATGDDEDNLVVSLLAKQEFAVPRVIARVNHPQNEWMFNEMWGVDAAVEAVNRSCPANLRARRTSVMALSR